MKLVTKIGFLVFGIGMIFLAVAAIAAMPVAVGQISLGIEGQRILAILIVIATMAISISVIILAQNPPENNQFWKRQIKLF